jgi:hypothetical protein
MPARIAAGLLATVILVSGGAQRAFVFLEQDQSHAQLAKDQAKCTTEAKENTRSAEAVKKGLSTTLGASVAGLGVKASAQQAQDLVDDAFRRCMEKRGYKVGRERA